MDLGERIKLHNEDFIIRTIQEVIIRFIISIKMR